MREAGDRVKCYHEELNQITDNKVLISVSTIRNYIKRLKPGSSAGVDRVTPEHLKHAMDSKLPLLLSVLLSLCLRHGVVPNAGSGLKSRSQICVGGVSHLNLANWTLDKKYQRGACLSTWQ